MFIPGLEEGGEFFVAVFLTEVGVIEEVGFGVGARLEPLMELLDFLPRCVDECLHREIYSFLSFLVMMTLMYMRVHYTSGSE